jgi:hypothetical protein
VGLIYDRYRDYDYMPYDLIDPWDDVVTPKKDVLYDLRHASIVRMSAQDFGSGYRTPATRQGWWHVKNMDSGMKVVNAMANRAVVVWAYPENIRP